MEPGGLCWTNVLNLVLPTQRHKPDTWLEHEDPVSHTAQKKWRQRKEERKEGREGGREEGRRKEGWRER